MPRCHIRCNVITDPESSHKRRLHCTDIMPYLSCFFHVPVKVVYEVLGMSHHTMAPIRRQWSLSRWPFADVCRGYFKMKGAYVTWDDIEAKRKSMVAGADERIVKILEVMGQRALEHKHKVNMVVTRMRHEDRIKRLENKLNPALDSSTIILPPVLSFLAQGVPVLPSLLSVPPQVVPVQPLSFLSQMVPVLPPAPPFHPPVVTVLPPLLSVPPPAPSFLSQVVPVSPPAPSFLSQQPMKTEEEEEVLMESQADGGGEDFFENLLRLLDEEQEPPPLEGGELFAPPGP